MVPFVEDCGLILSNDCTMTDNRWTTKSKVVVVSEYRADKSRNGISKGSE